MSLATLKKKTKAYHKTMSVGQSTFSLQGTHRNQGWVGQSMISRSLPRTLFRGDTARGSGGSNGTYDDSTVVGESTTGENLNDATVTKASSVGTAGMIATKYRWSRRPAPYISVSKADNTYTNTQEAYIRHIKHNNNQCVADLATDASLTSNSVETCIRCNDSEIKAYFSKNYTGLLRSANIAGSPVILGHTTQRDRIESLQLQCGSLDKFIWDSLDLDTSPQLTGITTSGEEYSGNRLFTTPGGDLATGDGIVYNTAPISKSITSTYYKVFSFGTDSITYTITYVVLEPVDIYVLAVGGGGGGGAEFGGGGGGGGVVQDTITLPVGTHTISIVVGAGGLYNKPGNTSTVSFDLIPDKNITAIGGGSGGTRDVRFGSYPDFYYVSFYPTIGGSGGGGGGDTTYDAIQPAYSIGKSGTINQGNSGGGGSYYINSRSPFIGGGGGGAGMPGLDYTTPRIINGINYFGSGGYGAQCVLPGISTIYPTQYWAGGGGASHALSYNNDVIPTNACGAGGLGGGGGGCSISAWDENSPMGIIEDTAITAINPGKGGTPWLANVYSLDFSLTTRSQGGRNTGGGGGGNTMFIRDIMNNETLYNRPNAISKGGSGIVVIAFV